MESFELPATAIAANAVAFSLSLHRRRHCLGRNISGSLDIDKDKICYHQIQCSVFSVRCNLFIVLYCSNTYKNVKMMALFALQICFAIEKLEISLRYTAQLNPRFYQRFWLPFFLSFSLCAIRFSCSSFFSLFLIFL